MLLRSQKEAGPQDSPTLGIVICRLALVGHPLSRGLVVMFPHEDTGPCVLKVAGCQGICSGLSLYCISGGKANVLLPKEEEESKWKGSSE